MAASGFIVPKKKAAPRKRGAGRAQQEWNGGSYGMPQPGRPVETPGQCRTPGAARRPTPWTSGTRR